MSRVTQQQKDAFLALARRYSPPVHSLVLRGGADEIVVKSRHEAAVLDESASGICTRVRQDYPDYEGKDADVNADAELIVHLVADILADHGFEIE